MPRQRRVHVPGGLYHAVLRGNHRQPIFSGTDDYLSFECVVAGALERYGASLFAYCWMTNHVHLAIRIAEAPLGSVMGIVASRYARAKQRAVPTTGHLFERRYRARLVDADRYLLALVRYIHLNPVRAQMVADARDYRWSSHRAYLGAPCPAWLCLDPVLSRFGPSDDAAHAAYRRFMCESPDPGEGEALTSVTRRGPVRSNERDRLVTSVLDAPHRRPPRSLETIAAEVARAQGVTVEELRSKRRRPELVSARVDIARVALLEGAANLSGVARYLSRAPTTISDLLHGRR